MDSPAITELGQAVSLQKRLRRHAVGDLEVSGDMQMNMIPLSSIGQLT